MDQPSHARAGPRNVPRWRQISHTAMRRSTLSLNPRTPYAATTQRKEAGQDVKGRYRPAWAPHHARREPLSTVGGCVVLARKNAIKPIIYMIVFQAPPPCPAWGLAGRPWRVGSATACRSSRAARGRILASVRGIARKIRNGQPYYGILWFIRAANQIT